MDITYCGKCGNKISGNYCKGCQKKTLIVFSSFERGFDIPQIPMSFDDKKDNYGMFMFKSNHIMHMLNLNTDTPFGNLELIFMNVLCDIEYLNQRIKETFRLYANAMHYDLSEKITDHQRSVEEVIYWMRRITDRLIAIHWLTAEYNISGQYPSVIKADSIGGLLGLKDENSFRKEYTSEDMSFIKFLNEASNAYKHSIVNGESPSLRIGKEEPLVISLGLKNNDISKDSKYNHKSLAETTLSFIYFYKGMRDKLEKVKIDIKK